MADRAPRTARQFADAVAEMAAGFRRAIEAGVEGFDPDPAAAAARRAAALESYETFAKTYFPHYVEHADSVLHRFLYARLPAMVDDPAGRRLAIAAPRGEAKSTLVSQVFVLWCAAARRKHYVLIVMDAWEQAEIMVEAIKAELEVNPRLAADFPELAGPGPVWRQGVVVTRTGVKIEGLGSGKKIRGRRHGPYRPDLVILDDVENDENVRSPEQRDKLERWIDKAVMKAGPPGGGLDVVFIGTILHYDSVLSRKRAHALWAGETFRAVLKWPDAMTLWDRWEAILVNDGEDAADAFHAERAAVLEAGAVVSWPSARPLAALMKIRAEDHAAFDSEYQNDPVNEEDATFGELTFFVGARSDWLFFGACDPSLGKGRHGDPSAILIGGYVRETGVLDVVEADIRRRLPDTIIRDLVDYQRRYRCLRWAIEAVQFQEFFRQVAIRESAKAGAPLPAVPYTDGASKDLRIQALQPHTRNGLIRFDRNHRTLLTQLRHFPKADHDDGPDALAMLWWCATTFMAPGDIGFGGRRRAGARLADFVGG